MRQCHSVCSTSVKFCCNLGLNFDFSLIIYTGIKLLTYRVPEETPRCLQHKSPPPHSGRPLVRLRHECINTYPHRTTPLNDNHPETTSKCLRTHLSSVTRHSSHRHSGLHPTYIMAPPKRTSMTPLGRPIIKDTQMSLSDAVIATQDRPSWRSLVRDATRPATQAT